MSTNPFEAFRHARGRPARAAAGTIPQNQPLQSTHPPVAALGAPSCSSRGARPSSQAGLDDRVAQLQSPDQLTASASRSDAGADLAESDLTGHGTWKCSASEATMSNGADTAPPAKRTKTHASASPSGASAQQPPFSNGRKVKYTGNGSPAGPAKVYEGPGLTEKLGGAEARPLRLIIVGHNPSEEAWRQGHVYAHRSNRMWPILIKTGIAPPGTKGPEADDGMPSSVGVGFCDVGTGHPGTDSSQFKSEVFIKWQKEFYGRLQRHVATACETIGCTCGSCGAPALVAFSGKRHYLELLNIGKKGAAKVKTVELGKQPRELLPPGWPFSYEHTEVYVCTSTSGATPLTNAEREAPYMALAERLAQVPWPRTGIPRCRELGGVGEGAGDR